MGSIIPYIQQTIHVFNCSETYQATVIRQLLYRRVFSCRLCWRSISKKYVYLKHDLQRTAPPKTNKHLQMVDFLLTLENPPFEDVFPFFDNGDFSGLSCWFSAGYLPKKGCTLRGTCSVHLVGHSKVYISDMPFLLCSLDLVTAENQKSPNEVFNLSFQQKLGW